MGNKNELGSAQINFNLNEDQTGRDRLKEIIAAHKTMPSLETLLVQFATKTADTLTMDEQQKQACHQLAEAAIQSDKVTHLYDGNFDVLMVNAANLHANETQIESYLIGGDFSNLFHCNEALTKPVTNEIMAIIIDIYKQELNNISPHLLYGSRSGGDEFRFVVTGVSETELQLAIDKAQTRIEQFVAELGLEHLQHSKQKDNPVKSGIGAEVAWKKLPVIPFPSRTLDRELDDTISAKKIKTGERKVSQKEIKLESPEAISESEERKQHIESVISKYKSQMQHTIQSHEKAFPFKDVKTDKQRDIFRTRKAQTLRMSHTLRMNKDQDQFFSYLLEDIYDKKEDKTGLRGNRDFIYSLKDLQDKAKQDNTPTYLVKMEAYNFSSLNEIFSHHGNDTMFKQLADIAAKHLEKMDSLSFYRGGGIIAPIIIGKNADEINKVLESIIEDFFREIGNKSIKEYCDENNITYSVEALQKLNITEDTKIKDIPSVRGFKPGSGFVVSKVDLRESANFQEALSKLDDLNKENKELGIAFRSEDKIMYLNGESVSPDGELVISPPNEPVSPPVSEPVNPLQDNSQKKKQSTTASLFGVFGVKEMPKEVNEKLPTTGPEPDVAAQEKNTAPIPTVEQPSEGREIEDAPSKSRFGLGS